jgi:hypothetical protein
MLCCNVLCAMRYAITQYPISTVLTTLPRLFTAIDFTPVKEYLFSRLVERVVEYGGEASAVSNWTVEVCI